MALRKECAVCHKKYMGFLNDNWVRFYNKAIAQFDQLPQNLGRKAVTKDLFVCKHCAETASTVKCGLCEWSTESCIEMCRDDQDLLGKLLGRAGRDVNRDLMEIDYSLEGGKLEIEDLVEFLKAFGFDSDAQRVAACPYWVCDECTHRLVEKALKSCHDCSDTDLFLKTPIVHREGYCSRCGEKVDHDCGWFMGRFYRPWMDESWCPQELTNSEIWPLVFATAMTFLDDDDVYHGANGKEREQLLKYGNAIRLEAGSENDSFFLFAHGSLCHKCAPFLLPENVKRYAEHMLRAGWEGVLPSTSVCSTFQNEVKSGLLKPCKSASEVMAVLRDEAISLGANALIDFHCEKHKDLNCPDAYTFTGGAIPIRVKPDQVEQGENHKGC